MIINENQWESMIIPQCWLVRYFCDTIIPAMSMISHEISRWNISVVQLIQAIQLIKVIQVIVLHYVFVFLHFCIFVFFSRRFPGCPSALTDDAPRWFPAPPRTLMVRDGHWASEGGGGGWGVVGWGAVCVRGSGIHCTFSVQTVKCIVGWWGIRDGHWWRERLTMKKDFAQERCIHSPRLLLRNMTQHMKRFQLIW